MNIGKAVKHARVKRGLLQSELSKQAGLSLSYISLLETGQRNPNLSVIVRISKAFRIPTFLLIFGAELLDTDIEKIIGRELAEKLSYELMRKLQE